MSKTIIANQARIIAHLEGKQETEVMNELVSEVQGRTDDAMVEMAEIFGVNSPAIRQAILNGIADRKLKEE